MAEIIVADVQHAEYQDVPEGHKWVVEGDFGFLASFPTQSEAWKYAEEEVRCQKEIADVEITIQLNA